MKTILIIAFIVLIVVLATTTIFWIFLKDSGQNTEPVSLDRMFEQLPWQNGCFYLYAYLPSGKTKIYNSENAVVPKGGKLDGIVSKLLERQFGTVAIFQGGGGIVLQNFEVKEVDCR